MNIKLIYCEKRTRYKSTYWRLEFICEGDFSVVRQALREFVAESFTPGQLLYVATDTLQTYKNNCSFTARVYEDRDAMMCKLTYG